MTSSRKTEIAVILFLLLLPLLWFAPQALGGKTLLPADNLFTFEPWRSFAAQYGVDVPHNGLISDLILENRAWKAFLLETLRDGDPAAALWSPRLFAGAPFLAAGQQSALYPLSLLFYLLPLAQAYGVFTWLQLGLAAAGMYVFGRVLSLRRPAAAFAGIAYAFSGFFIVSVNFTMIIAAAAWLPLILAAIEMAVRTAARKTGGAVNWERGKLVNWVPGKLVDREQGKLVNSESAQPANLPTYQSTNLPNYQTTNLPTYRSTNPPTDHPTNPIPYILAGALCLGFETLAGHVEITYYTLMVAAFYAAWRLIALWRQLRTPRPALRLAGWLVVMVALGLAIGGAQLVPLYELVTQSFREGSASLQQVRDWAWPSQQILTFLLPDFFGNPTHHAYFDIWRRVWTPVTQNALGEPLRTIDWGVKNYVEGGNYLGIVTLLLAAVAVLRGLRWCGAIMPVYKEVAEHPERSRGGGPGVVEGGEADVPTRTHPSTAHGDTAAVLRSGCLPGLRAAVSSQDTAASGTPQVLGTPTLFAVLAVLSLLFAFGTPLYALLYYGLPGYSQLHSAFRWVFPYTLSMAVLAGYGLDALSAGIRGQGTGVRNQFPGLGRILGWLTVVVGVGALAAVLISMAVPGPFVALGDRLLAWPFWADRVQSRGFADGAMLWSYEATGLARFGLMALLAGGVLVWISRKQGNKETGKQGDKETRGEGLVYLSTCLPLTLILILDLWLFGRGFNPATDPKLLDFTPPAIEFLQSQQDAEQPWRLTSFDAPGEKVLNANSAMVYGLEDVRGYDSIILKQYVAYMARIQRQDDLLYNRIAPIYTQIDGRPNYDALDNPLLDLLGVRYVVSTHTIPNAGYELAYDAEVKVYENRGAFPRVFIVPEAVAAADQAQALDLLQTVDPAQVVVIEGVTAAELPPPASPQVREARISQRGNREVFVDVNLSDRGWLVFTDSYFAGWKAYLRPFGVQGEGINAQGESIEQQLPLYRADGAFRTVYLPQAGQWTVRFVYSPRSFLLGLYLSFLSGVVLLLLGGWWAWRRFYRGERSEMGTVAKNSAVQMGMSLLSKGIDFAFAMLRLRVLSPAGEGSYAFAIAFYGIFEIITRFGLGTLATRDVAIDRSRAQRYLANTIVLRAGLWLLSLPVMGLVALFYRVVLNQLTGAEIQAIALFALALLFANVSDAISAIFNAFEKMEYPAAIATAIATAKVALGALVLLPPFESGFVGLAGVSLVMNIVQMVWLWAALRSKVLAEPHMSRGTAGQRSRGSGHNLSLNLSLNLDLALQRHMLRESGPLMINNLLATVFWRISQFVLRGATNPAALGIFSAGVKWLDGLNVIPAYFTLAIFPLMSRYAQAGKEALVKGYQLALQLLFMVALPIAVVFTFAATPLIQLLGGAAYLPDSATALRIMIWSIPIGFVNSVTQYVLIAVNQQRFLTKAFIAGVVFTGLANLIFIPRFGYVAAAIIQIPAELALFIPFSIAVRRYVAPMPWMALLGRPLLAAGINVAVVWGLLRLPLPLLPALATGALGYIGALWALGAFRREEFAILRGLLRRRR